MLAPRPASMTMEEYLTWEAAQAEKHEFVDGQVIPRRMRMMAGGTGRHARLAANAIRALGNALRGGPCAPYGSDLKVQCATGSARYPDVTVDCSPLTGRAVFAQDPRVVIEVLSPANDTMAITRLMYDYQSIASLSAIVFVAQDAPYMQVFAREGAGWRLVEVNGLEGGAALPGLDVTLPMAELYEGVSFDPPEAVEA